jgi:hypothetical protein
VPAPDGTHNTQQGSAAKFEAALEQKHHENANEKETDK